MTNRVWTEDEINKIWPPPTGWTWLEDQFGNWCLQHGDKISVYCHPIGGIACSRPVEVQWSRQQDGAELWQIPNEVLLAVIGVRLGLDSPAWIADTLNGMAQVLLDAAPVAGPIMCKLLESNAETYCVSADMIRKGRARP